MKKKINKIPFDKNAFVFDTPIELIEDAIKRLEAQDADPMAEPFTQDEIYYWCYWQLNLPEAKRRGMLSVPCSAVESAVLKLPRKSKAKRKTK